MSLVFQAIAVLLGVVVVAFAGMALAAGYRAVRIAGWRLLLQGVVLFRGSERVPAEAWPHLRHAMERRGPAMPCFVLVGATRAISGALA